MTSLKTMRRLTCLAVLLAIATGQAALAAQPTPTKESTRQRLEQTLRTAQSNLEKYERVLVTADDRITFAWSKVRRVEFELGTGRQPKDAYLELVAVADEVTQVDKQLEQVTAGLLVVQDSLKNLMAESQRYRLFDIYRYANVAMGFSDELGRITSATMDRSTDLAGEIDRIMKKISR